MALYTAAVMAASLEGGWGFDDYDIGLVVGVFIGVRWGVALLRW